MTASVRPTYQAIVDQAMAATGASTGWLLRSTDDGLVVAATAGKATAGNLLGEGVIPTGAQGYVLSSGQPVALMPPPNDPANDGAAGFPGVPTSVLAAPCGDESVLGVLELADKSAAKPFTFDDIETASALAVIAGAAMTEDDGTALDVVSPAELAAELQRLASESPRRYADTARMIESLLGQGA
jgi:GAF domain-containing protein